MNFIITGRVIVYWEISLTIWNSELKTVDKRTEKWQVSVIAESLDVFA